MNELMRTRQAAWLLFVLLTLFSGFHILVLLEVFSTEMVWGSGLKTRSQVLRLESVALVISFLMIMVMLLYLRIWKFSGAKKIARVGLSVMMVLFAINSVGNLLSPNPVERFFFTPLTIIMTWCAWLCLRNPLLSRRPSRI